MEVDLYQIFGNNSFLLLPQGRKEVGHYALISGALWEGYQDMVLQIGRPLFGNCWHGGV